jgi:hypothetical protein
MKDKGTFDQLTSQIYQENPYSLLDDMDVDVESENTATLLSKAM